MIRWMDYIDWIDCFTSIFYVLFNYGPPIAKTNICLLREKEVDNLLVTIN